MTPGELAEALEALAVTLASRPPATTPDEARQAGVVGVAAQAILDRAAQLRRKSA